MSLLSFRLDLGSGDLSSLPLPVEVRNASRQIIARTVTTRSVEVRRPGSYYVTARLPAGQELIGEVKLSAGQDETVVLGPRGASRSTDTSREGWAYLSSSATPATSAPEVEARARRVRLMGGAVSRFTDESGSGTIKLRSFVGNVLSGLPEEIEPPVGDVTVEGDVRRLRLQGWTRVSDEGPRLLQLLQPFEPPLNIALPVDLSEKATATEASWCWLYIRTEPDGHVSVEPHLPDPSADMLLRFLAEDLLQEAATATQFEAIPAAQLVLDTVKDPIRAAVGAYALLRFGELESLHDWTEDLRVWFPSLPDGAAIRGEHLARAGKHREALQVFLELAQRGLPIFTAGFFYAVDRLSLYIRVADSMFTPDEQSAAQALLDNLNRFVTFVDRKAAFLTYPGGFPSLPSRDSLGDSTVDFGGHDITDVIQPMPG